VETDAKRIRDSPKLIKKIDAAHSSAKFKCVYPD